MRAQIVARRNRVLHESLRHAADGAGAKADQRVGGIVGVALEVAFQPAVLSGNRQTVAGKGEMIEADADVARVLQGCRDGFGLQVPSVLSGKAVFGNLALMLLERWHMGVAEHRKAVRPELDAFGDGVETRTHRLQRKPVQQVEIDPADARPAQTLDGNGGLFKTLQPVDGALHGRVEALNAQARAVDAAIAERLGHRLRQRARIDLDGDFGIGNDEKRIA